MSSGELWDHTAPSSTQSIRRSTEGHGTSTCKPSRVRTCSLAGLSLFLLAYTWACSLTALYPVSPVLMALALPHSQYCERWHCPLSLQHCLVFKGLCISISGLCLCDKRGSPLPVICAVGFHYCQCRLTVCQPHLSPPPSPAGHQSQSAQTRTVFFRSCVQPDS